LSLSIRCTTTALKIRRILCGFPDNKRGKFSPVSILKTFPGAGDGVIHPFAGGVEENREQPMHSTLFRRVSAGLTMLLLSGMASATDWLDRSNENMRPGVTEASQQIYHLHNLVLIIVTLIGVLVVALMLYSMVRHRRSANPNPAKFHENIFLEVMWTVIPFVILIGMAIPATRVLIFLDDTSDSELTVMVTGYRWNWSYEYLTYEDDNDINVFFFSNLATPREQYFNPVLSGGLFPHGTAQDLVGTEFPEKDHLYQLEVDKPLVIPSGQKVRFLLTADDVIHSFWVPDFGGKKDAIPGFVNET
jgi:cytochrome c oxidase subunit 2